MFVNAKQKNQALPQKNLKTKPSFPSKPGAVSSKAQSSKNVNCVFKNSKNPKASKQSTKVNYPQDENDKNYKNLDPKLTSLNPIEEKQLNLSNSKDDSALKENELEKASKEILMKDFDNPITLFTTNEFASNTNIKKEQMSLNLENYLTNVNIIKNNKQIPRDEYREL